MLITIIVLAFEPAARADDTSVSILYYESIRLVLALEPGKQGSTLAAHDERPASMSFDAYGRRFELLLDDESRAVAGTRFKRLRGRLAGLPGSWFTLLRDGEELSGIIADGVDTYLIEPHRRVTDLLIDTPPDGAGPNVIFRLADTLVPPGLMSCATNDDAERTDGQAALTKLSSELQVATINAVAPNDPRLLIGVVADKKFVASHQHETDDEIAIIFNAVQGIFANEIGIEIEIDRVYSVTDDVVDPFSETVVAGDLLDELRDWRNANQADLGHTHLLTRKKLVSDSGGSLAGISFLGQPGRSGICSPTTGASLSRDIRGLTALIIAHELGHNLGAPHDGETGGTCVSESSSQFIMSPSISRSTAMSFSNCSVAQIDQVIAAASCLGETTSALTAPNTGGGGGSLGWLTILVLFIGAVRRRYGREDCGQTR